MTHVDRRALRLQLQAEFPELELHDWYIQYRTLKASYPETILLYRLGEFYETFDDDAKLVAEKLGVTLTHRPFATPKGSKNKRQEQRSCPMAGMPFHSIERYVGTLVAEGYRVAVAEQLSETPSSKSDTRPRSVYAHAMEQNGPLKGTVDRKVVRVLTPGTLMDGGMLTAERNNYLVALIADAGKVGLAYVDLSTGEFAATEFTGERSNSQAQSELGRLQAAEVLVPDKAELRLAGLEPASAQLTQDLEFMTKDEREMLLPGERVARRIERENNTRWAHGHITASQTWRWELRTARDTLLRQFGVQSLAGVGLADKPLATRAAGAIIQYLDETQAGTVGHITTLHVYALGDTMVLDPQTRRNLELLEGASGRAKGSLVEALDQTRTPMGARLLRRWVAQPLLDHTRLIARQDAVAHFVNDTLQRAEVREALRQIGDLERVVNRVIQGASTATPRDMAKLREALRALPNLLQALGGWEPPSEVRLAVQAEDTTIADDLLFDDQPESEAEQLPVSQGPSLREQREARRKVQARYDSDDLFGDESWDEPAAQPVAAPKKSVKQNGSANGSHTTPPVRRSVVVGLEACADVLALLEEALDDDPPALLGYVDNYLRESEGEQLRRVIRPGFVQRIDEIVLGNRKAREYFSRLEQTERERTGIKSLRVDYTKVFGYYIEVPRHFADQVPAEYIRKQTLTTGERYYTETMKLLEQQLDSAKIELMELERQAFVQLCGQIAEQGARLLGTARALAAVDVYAGLAEAAVRGRYVRPSLHDDTRLRITAGRHPVVERSLDEAYIPNDALLDTDEQQLLIVTGPNMSGKSSFLRQVALIVLMAQIGSYVPADAAEIGLVDRIFTRIGAQDDIATGQSTFMVEMTETAALLLQSTERSLIILDEVGRGTSTYDGMAIARAVVEYIHNEPRLGCRTLFATHYHELTALDQVLPRVKNFHMAAVEQDGRVVFLHELRGGGADRSYGIHVAELAGIPRSIIRRANELLAELEQHESGTARHEHAARPKPAQQPVSNAQPSLFDLAPNPVIEMLRRINVNELTPLEAMTRLYELQRLANQS